MQRGLLASAGYTTPDGASTSGFGVCEILVTDDVRAWPAASPVPITWGDGLRHQLDI